MRRASTSSASSRTIRKSRFIPYAFLAFGEYFFEQKHLENALKFYDKVLQFPRIADLRICEIQRGLGLLQPRAISSRRSRRSSSVIELRNQRRRGQARRRSRSARKRRRTRCAPTRASARRRRRGTSSAHRRRLRDDDDGAARRALQRAGPVPGLDQGLPQADGRSNPESPKLCFWQGEVMKNTLSATGSRAHAGQRQGAAAPRRGLREGQGRARTSRRSSSRSAATTPPNTLASSRPSGTRKRRRRTTTIPMRSRSISIRNI